MSREKAEGAGLCSTGEQTSLRTHKNFGGRRAIRWMRKHFSLQQVSSFWNYREKQAMARFGQEWSNCLIQRASSVVRNRTRGCNHILPSYVSYIDLKRIVLPHEKNRESQILTKRRPLAEWRHKLEATWSLRGLTVCFGFGVTDYILNATDWCARC